MNNKAKNSIIGIGALAGVFMVALFAKGKIIHPDVEIISGYIRPQDPWVSEFNSGWTSIVPGIDINILDAFGIVCQVGAVLRNPTKQSFSYITEVYDRYSGEYIYPAMPTTEPFAYPPAPTGLPYSDGQYECDKFLAPDDELQPGETGFVYTDYFSHGQLWNYVYITIICEDVDLGKWLLYAGLVY